MPLSFFTNAGNSYGTSVPFQRIVEPAQLGMFLNLEQAELLRIQRYNEAWRFYFGKQWLFHREDGEPLVTVNIFRKIIDKCAAFLAGNGFTLRTPEALEEVTLPFLNEVWKANGKDKFAWDAALMGGVTGDVFALVTFEEPTPMQRQINPHTQGKILVRLLGSEQVFPTFDPLNIDNLIAARIETVFYVNRVGMTLDKDDRQDHQGRQLQTKRFTQILTASQIIEQAHGEMPIIKPNYLGEIPLIHIPNMAVPKEYYGIPDGQDLISLQQEYNEKLTDVSDTVNYHAHPQTIIFGAKAKQLNRDTRGIWSGLPADARVENLQLNGDMAASSSYLDRVESNIHKLSDVPKAALSMEGDAISNTSGVALHMKFLPLIERTKRKQVTYKAGFEQLNYFLLRVGVVMGLLNLPYDICANCGGRIVEVDTGKTRKVWDSSQQRYVLIPLKQRKCYHIDKQTLEFQDPVKMRVKFWRKFGFGKQLAEKPLDLLERELTEGKKSFWDYSEILKGLQEKHREENPKEEPPPKDPEVQREADMAEAKRPPEKEDPDADLPEEIKVDPIPEHELDLPPEPENVEVTMRWVHPQTQEILEEETQNLFLVPTDCNRPQYLNPYENEVEFPNPLPKDDVIYATLLEQYQKNGWVDEEYCRERIPEIAEAKIIIERRMKKKKAALPAGPGGDPEAGGRQANVMGSDANARQAGKVPGKGGNPVPPKKAVTEELSMRIPSPFVPSALSRTLTYSIEGKLRVDDRVNQGKWPGMGAANSMYPTEAERFDSITPFLKAAKFKDAPRRNYVIQPGGAVIYFDSPPDMVEAIYGTPSTAHIPTDKESFDKGLSQAKPAAVGRFTGTERLWP